MRGKQACFTKEGALPFSASFAERGGREIPNSEPAPQAVHFLLDLVPS